MYVIIRKQSTYTSYTNDMCLTCASQHEFDLCDSFTPNLITCNIPMSKRLYKTWAYITGHIKCGCYLHLQAVTLDL